MPSWKMDKLCKSCNKMVAVIVPTPAGPRCWKCAPPKRGYTRKARVDRAAAGPLDAEGAREPASPLHAYLKLHADVEALKERHRAELSNALRAIESFESVNGDVVDGARAVYDRIFASGKLLTLKAAPAEANGETAP